MAFSILKFGGTSVANTGNWPLIKGFIDSKLSAGKTPVLVLSALAGASNLLEVIAATSANNNHKASLAELETLYRDFAKHMGISPSDEFQLVLDELSATCDIASSLGRITPVHHAMICASGELLITHLIADYLQQQYSKQSPDLTPGNSLSVQFLDAREMLKVDEAANRDRRRQYLSAVIDHRTNQLLIDTLDKPNTIYVTQGFIGSNAKDETVLLGRGGSDTSAACLASVLAAAELEIWTDVPGMFSANPHQIPAARLLTALDYDEAQEIASTGAKVLHPRAIAPAKSANVAIHIKSVQHPELPGTKIDAGRTDTARVKAVSMRTGLILIALETEGMWQQSGFLGEVFSIFARHGISIDLVSTSETNVTVSLDAKANELDRDLMQLCVDELNAIADVEIMEPVASISIVGRHIRRVLPRLGPALEAFGEHRIHLLSLASSDLNLTFIVDQEQSNRLMVRLHELLIEELGHASPFGPSWQSLMSDEHQPRAPEAFWWEQNASKLIKLYQTQEQDALYVYQPKVVKQQIAELNKLSAVDNIFYALKANNHPQVLEQVYQAGLGFECVSPGEIKHVQQLFPEIDPKRILFTPNFAEKAEYQWALEQDVFLTLDNIYPLQHWPELFTNKKVFIRIDPGHGRGHHAHVKTAGRLSKFGIPLFEVAELKRLVDDCQVKVIGLHAHSGSGIRVNNNWADVGRVLAEVAHYFPAIKYLDLGGGLGIPEKPGDKPLDLAQVNASLTALKEAYPEYQLWLEPGRFIVANAGILLSKVTQLKGKGETRYVGLSTGMNSLIRPMLYGAWHPISNLSRTTESNSYHYQVVGPICETGDRFAADYLLPECFEGDIIAIGNAGAYSATMSSSYNMREPAIEVIFEED